MSEPNHKEIAFQKRKEKFLTDLDVRESFGIEIGPLGSPLVTKAEGKIIYVDHTEAANLRERYRGNPIVDCDKIVEVDAIWGENTIAQAIGLEKVDYVLASHVVEHVPDLITWLQELRSVLKPTGQVRLLVPDRRYTFDYLRRESRIHDVLRNYWMRARRPPPHSVLEFNFYSSPVDMVKAWDGLLDTSELIPTSSYSRAVEMAEEAKKGTYHDTHCWVFTPQSFAHLFGELAEFGFIDFACERFWDTVRYEIEFSVVLRPSSDKEATVESWRKMAASALKSGIARA
ncbi:MAG: class I SAM-dependent methyltransferase [Acidobacteriota bacterium]|nr:class I SAM-dependent methyltransferase [Acidobacteriota bacterium]